MRGDLAGQRLGELELVYRLGSGGMGEVWLARQQDLGRQVAVKILPPTTDRRAIDRLRREAQALAQIRHPHVVPVHEVGELDGVRHDRALRDLLGDRLRTPVGDYRRGSGAARGSHPDERVVPRRSAGEPAARREPIRR